MGDGGFMTTDDDALARQLFALRVHGSENVTITSGSD
jgi:dTDP-4-amino-4,6-dideoxygalactose transaminase